MQCMLVKQSVKQSGGVQANIAEELLFLDVHVSTVMCAHILCNVGNTKKCTLAKSCI